LPEIFGTAALAVAWPSAGAPAKGSYYGLFSDPNHVSQQSCGSVTITTTAKGAFGGQLQVNGTRASIRGAFDSAGKASLTVKSGKMNSLSLELQLVSSPDDASIVGSVSDGNWTAGLFARHAGFDGKGNVAPQAGRYTVLILARAGSPTTPAGYGYGTVSVNKAGKASLVGTLADGTKISQAGVLSKEGWWPFYVSLYAGQGSAMSWIPVQASTVAASSEQMAAVVTRVSLTWFFIGWLLL